MDVKKDAKITWETLRHVLYGRRSASEMQEPSCHTKNLPSTTTTESATSSRPQQLAASQEITSGDLSEVREASSLSLLAASAPDQVRLSSSTLPGHSSGVFAIDILPEGTEIGPYVGRIVQPWQVNPNKHNQHMWEDVDDVYQLCYRTQEEQNLSVTQRGTLLFYKTLRTVKKGEELLVWYNPIGDSCMGIPSISSPTNSRSSSEKSNSGSFSTKNLQDLKTRTKSKRKCHALQADATSTSDCDDLQQIKRLQSEIPSTKHLCSVCQRAFNSRSNLRSHMRIHTLEKPFQCRYCQRRFSQSSTLRNHIRLHTGEKPYRCERCHSSYSQLAGLRAHQKSARHKSPLH